MNSQLTDFNALMQDGQQMSLESLWPETVSFDGVDGTFACSCVALRETGSALLEGGFLGDFDLRLRIRQNLLDAKPAIRTNLTFRGKIYTIKAVSTPTSDGVWLVTADNPNK